MFRILPLIIKGSESLHFTEFSLGKPLQYKNLTGIRKNVLLTYSNFRKTQLFFLVFLSNCSLQIYPYVESVYQAAEMFLKVTNKK